MNCDDWDLHLVDSFGDGWNGATLSVSTCDIYGTVTEIGSIFPWTEAKKPRAGYEITAGGGNWDGEISWTLFDGVSGSFEAADVCLPADTDGEWIGTAGGGNWDGEISWTFFDTDGV